MSKSTSSSTIRPASRVALAAVALVLAGLPAASQDVQRLSVPLSEPGRPVTLHASLLQGGIEVTAHDGRDVEIEVVPQARRDGADAPGRDGMRRIPNTSLGLTVEEHGNVVRVGADWSSRLERVRIRVPRSTSMSLQCTNGGDIEVSGVEGELELQNTNGSISALGVAGSVVAQTTNGNVTVSFRRIDRDQPMSFVTFNGDVDVTFPSGLAADLRINAGRGEVLTDFDFEVQPHEPRVRNRGDGGHFSVEIQREVRATVGGGGPEMHFKTWNGDVLIRRGTGDIPN